MVYTYKGIVFCLKIKEILTHGTTQMNRKDIMLNKYTSHKKTNIASFHLYEVPAQNRQIHRDRRWNGGCQRLGEGRRCVGV